MSHQVVDYNGWNDCHRLFNGLVDIIALKEAGIRLLRFGFNGQHNEFYEDPTAPERKGHDQWQLIGGHRLWHAPEDRRRTYQADNAPVEIDVGENRLVITQAVEAKTGLQKQVEVQMHPTEAAVRVTHRFINHSLWDVTFAPWALSVMAAGGVGVLPISPRGSHAENLLPSDTLTLWAYTEMDDPRWTWGKESILLRQDPAAQYPQKIGVSGVQGWAGYVRDGHFFLCRFEHNADAIYPDDGVAAELFTNNIMLEVETLAPWVTLAPQTSTDHIEDWHLFDGVDSPSSDADVKANLLPKIEQARAIRF